MERGTLVAVDLVPYGDRVQPRLWIRRDGRVEPLVDASFEPYFYALPEAGADPRALAAALGAAEAEGSAPLRAEVVRRRHGLADLDVVRVVAPSAGVVPALAKAADGMEGVAATLESDVPFHLRYLLDRRLAAPGPVVFSASGGLATDVAPGDHAPEPLRVAALVAEPLDARLSPGLPANPVVCAALATGEEDALVLRADDLDDRALLRDLVEAVRTMDPDVLLTFDGDARDLQHLRARAERHDVPLALGRDETAPGTRAGGAGRAMALAGRHHVDLLRTSERDVPEVRVPTLRGVAEHLGVGGAGVRRAEPGAWADEGRRDALASDVRASALATLALGRALLPLEEEFARLTHLPLDEASRAGRGRQVDQVLLAAASAEGRLAPGKGASAGVAAEEAAGAVGAQYEGGLVLEPRPGLHEGVVAVDFRAMYPSIMVARNVSPETLVPASAAGDGTDLHVAPDVGHAFRREPPGFFAAIVDDLVRRRRAMKVELARLPHGSSARSILDARQNALKVLTNACYGYLGWTQARWGSREAAEAVTAWGRGLIREAERRAVAHGIEVLYGDTDSLFLRDRPEVDEVVRSMNAELPVEIEVQDRFAALLLTSAKKRYAGITTDGRVVVRGLETRRGDWCSLAHAVQADVLDAVLRRRDPRVAAERVREVVRRLRAGEVPLGDLVIHKTLTMSPKRYRAKAAHLAAVERAMREHPSFRVPVGAKVGYVVLDAGQDDRPRGRALAADDRHGGDDGLVSGRTKLVEFLASDDRPDVAYYVDRQVLPAALRVLEHFGWTAEELKGAPRQTRLF